MNHDLIKQIEIYTTDILKSSSCDTLTFHNCNHTLEVVQNCKEIGKGEAIDDLMMEELIIAAYFHDLGYLEGPQGHENRSSDLAQYFLKQHNYDEQRILNIVFIIKATKMPQQPVTISEKIICDADLAHLGKIDFFQKNEMLRKEWFAVNNIQFTNEQWFSMNLQFLEQHHFHTSYAKQFYVLQKQKNLSFLKKEILECDKN